jgi:hypothetical protein
VHLAHVMPNHADGRLFDQRHLVAGEQLEEPGKEPGDGPHHLDFRFASTTGDDADLRLVGCGVSKFLRFHPRSARNPARRNLVRNLEGHSLLLDATRRRMSMHPGRKALAFGCSISLWTWV